MYPNGITSGAKADRDVTFLRLLVEARREDGGAVQDVVRDTLGPDWRGRPWDVAPLFGTAGSDGGAPQLSHFFEATGAVQVRQLDRLAWQLSYALEDTEAFLSVRPDLPTGSYQIDGTEGEEGAVGGGEEDLPESASPTWALESIRVPAAWSLPPRPGGRSHGEGIVIGHPDTGYTPHPQVGLEALDRERDWDFVSEPEDDDALDPLVRSSIPLTSFPGHGTGTSSVIAGRGEGRLTGVAPRAVLVPIRAIRSVIEVKEGDVARAIHYATEHGAYVISMSLGGLPFAGVKAAVDHAVGQGVIVMAAAGNYVPFRPVVWPARYRNCIAVAAVDARDEPWDGSSHGKAIAVAAPGTGVWVASWDLSGPEPRPRGIRQSRGTSHAVAHVAGVAALWLGHHGRDALLERYGSRLCAAFRHLAATTSRRPARWDRAEWGSGIIDAAALLEAELPDPATLDGPEEEALFDEAVPSLQDLLPPDVVDQAGRRLGAVLGAETVEDGDPASIAESLGRYNDELLYLLMEKPDVRAALTSPSTGLETPGAPEQTLRAVLRRTASPALLRHAGLA